MPDDDEVKFPDDFLYRIESGLVDDDFIRELGSLTEQQREELAHLWIERQVQRAQSN